MPLHHRVNHITDSHLTQGEATQKLPLPIIITWFTNRTNVQSVVHSHPYYELILPLYGGVMYSVNGSLVHLNEGELIVLPADIYHYGKYDISTDVSDRLLAQIDQTFWDQIATEEPFHELCRLKTPLVFNASDVAAWEIRSFFEQMDLNRNIKDPVSQLMLCSNMLRTLFIYMTESLHNQHSPELARNQLVEKAVSYIQEHFTDPELTVYDIAEYTFSSREHLSRLFKRYTMESIHSYITELRMQHFHQLLREGKSIMDSCNYSGFSDYSSFTRSFKKIHNMSPTQYMKSLENMDEQNFDS
ncbi:DNA-binding domain-containing protein, AraC-type [Lachnospiraceae bacterium JC7]|nr:DNA-binding domain-containing protein, AraC-type [Lachnospiraceae bacterium JC7]